MKLERLSLNPTSLASPLELTPTVNHILSFDTRCRNKLRMLLGIQQWPRLGRTFERIDTILNLLISDLAARLYLLIKLFPFPLWLILLSRIFGSRGEVHSVNSSDGKEALFLFSITSERTGSIQIVRLVRVLLATWQLHPFTIPLNRVIT